MEEERERKNKDIEGGKQSQLRVKGERGKGKIRIWRKVINIS